MSHESSKRSINQGVPQGSVLGLISKALFFSLFITYDERNQITGPQASPKDPKPPRPSYSQKQACQKITGEQHQHTGGIWLIFIRTVNDVGESMVRAGLLTHKNRDKLQAISGTSCYKIPQKPLADPKCCSQTSEDNRKKSKYFTPLSLFSLAVC